MLRTEAVVDLDAIRGNVATLNSATPAEVMAVVKADGYGHGLVPSAHAALSGGATWLGTAVIDEALELRAAGIAAPSLVWLWAPSETEKIARAIAADVDLSAASTGQINALAAAARTVSRAARIHLEIDTGLLRGGSSTRDWPDLLNVAAKAEAAGEVEIIGVWSHLASADEPGHPTTTRQVKAFRQALRVASHFGVQPHVRHLANSAATVTLPQAHFDLVRPGVAVYGLSPVPQRGDFGLIPAMTLRAALVSAKRVAAGEGVSYGHIYRTSRRTTVVQVPLGYADGIPRNATNVGPVTIKGKRFTVSGRVCMDQFVVDVGDLPVAAGDAAVLFGAGHTGEPLAQDWADATGTIHYEIVSRIGPRVARRYVGLVPPAWSAATM